GYSHLEVIGNIILTPSASEGVLFHVLAGALALRVSVAAYMLRHCTTHLSFSEMRLNASSRVTAESAPRRLCRDFVAAGRCPGGSENSRIVMMDDRTGGTFPNENRRGFRSRPVVAQSDEQFRKFVEPRQSGGRGRSTRSANPRFDVIAARDCIAELPGRNFTV